MSGSGVFPQGKDVLIVQLKIVDQPDIVVESALRESEMMAIGRWKNRENLVHTKIRQRAHLCIEFDPDKQVLIGLRLSGRRQQSFTIGGPV